MRGQFILSLYICPGPFIKEDFDGLQIIRPDCVVKRGISVLGPYGIHVKPMLQKQLYDFHILLKHGGMQGRSPERIPLIRVHPLFQKLTDFHNITVIGRLVDFRALSKSPGCREDKKNNDAAISSNRTYAGMYGYVNNYRYMYGPSGSREENDMFRENTFKFKFRLTGN